jgi:hypothetical protein
MRRFLSFLMAGAILLAGLALGVFELVRAEGIRPYLLIGAGLMIGAAGVWLVDEFLRIRDAGVERHDGDQRAFLLWPSVRPPAAETCSAGRICLGLPDMPSAGFGPVLHCRTSQSGFRNAGPALFLCDGLAALRRTSTTFGGPRFRGPSLRLSTPSSTLVSSCPCGPASGGGRACSSPLRLSPPGHRSSSTGGGLLPG